MPSFLAIVTLPQEAPAEAAVNDFGSRLNRHLKAQQGHTFGCNFSLNETTIQALYVSNLPTVNMPLFVVPNPFGLQG